MRSSAQPGRSQRNVPPTWHTILYQAGTAADVEKTVRYLEHAP